MNYALKAADGSRGTSAVLNAARTSLAVSPSYVTYAPNVELWLLKW